ncbi:MAG: phage morphogenesis protein [Spirochaetes bacterium]|nr:MAG: phage morphogenesis protein [Spirochaetota bacterium]
MEGNFDRLMELLENFKEHMEDKMASPLEEAGEIVRKNIVKGIRDQKWLMPPLAAKTGLRKAKLGHSPLILIAKGDYFASFTTERIRWDEVHVGTNHPQGRALEFGYAPRGLPARPHMTPALEESMPEVMEVIEEGYRKVFGV